MYIVDVRDSIPSGEGEEEGESFRKNAARGAFAASDEK